MTNEEAHRKLDEFEARLAKVQEMHDRQERFEFICLAVAIVFSLASLAVALITLLR